jgi:peptidoglycan hydrolase-like protein with peptidoglycan-binding domain
MIYFFNEKNILTILCCILFVPSMAFASQHNDMYSKMSTLLENVALLVAQLDTGSQSVNAESNQCPHIERGLGYGSRGDDVRMLQSFLVRENLLPADFVTGYFGSNTEAAVMKWQVAQHIVSSGSPLTTGYGLVGVRTLASFNASCAASVSQNTAAKEFTALSILPKKKSLVFNIDQNFGNGIVQKQDSVGLTRVMQAMKAFSTNYSVYAQVSTAASDKTKLEWMLSTLQKNNIQFILDVYTSDTITAGKSSVSAPFDISHGRQLSVTQLGEYKKRYGSYFAGVRVHEVFGEHAQIIGCKELNATWCEKFSSILPEDDFYQKAYLEEYVRFANQNSMFLVFSDHYWSTYAEESLRVLAHQDQNEKDLRDLAKKYPGTIIVMFANNEWNEGARDMSDTWPAIVQPYVVDGARGFGLSDQSWMCSDEMNCPAAELASWAKKAFAHGATMVQTEPYWYWWQFPEGLLGQQSYNYTTNTVWAKRGYPTLNLKPLADALGVTLPLSIRKYAGIAPTEIVSSLSAPSGLVAKCDTEKKLVQLSWNLSDYATGYWFRVTGIPETQCLANTGWQWVSAEGGICYPNPDIALSTPTVTFPVLVGKEYSWKVQASAGNLYSEWAKDTFTCN